MLVSKRKAAEKVFDFFCTPYSKAAVRIPAVFEQAESLHFYLDGLCIKGFRWGHPQKHKVLILHGFGSAAHKFHQYIKPLLLKGYEVLAFDAQAHGNSEGKRINAVEYSSMIDKVVKLYGPFNGFLAHSFGGMALSLSIENIPHNEHTKVVLIAPATETSSAVDSAFEILGLKNAAVRQEFDNIIFEKSGHKTGWFSINRAIQNIQASILWIHDEEDDITPLKDALKVKEQHLANIRFIITKGLGHSKIYSDQQVKNMVLEFL